MEPLFQRITHQDEGISFSPLKRMEQMISNKNTKIGASSSETRPRPSSRKRSVPTEEGFVGKKFRSIHKASLQSSDDIKVA